MIRNRNLITSNFQEPIEIEFRKDVSPGEYSGLRNNHPTPLDARWGWPGADGQSWEGEGRIEGSGWDLGVNIS